MRVDIDILDWASVSPLGSKREEIWEKYLSPSHCFTQSSKGWVAKIPDWNSDILSYISDENHKYKSLDRSALLAIATAREFRKLEPGCGINIGSSRGATELFEAHLNEFIKTGKTSPLASPSTTLGNLSSWVAQDLDTQGISMSHSITCSTALHSIANAAAWLTAGFSKQFIAGGSEAPLTAFTLAQMQAMRIYATDAEEEFPCKALDLDKTTNSMILGEGCCLFVLGKNTPSPAVKISSIGFATEPITHGSSISNEGISLEKAMRMALEDHSMADIDVIVMHAPGTIKGDQAELHAIADIWGNAQPLLTTNKWKIGHTLGSSGALSMEFAMLMLLQQTFIGLPWEGELVVPRYLNKIMVNAVGFGGNAVSVILEVQ